jgi:hypothetical protein
MMKLKIYDNPKMNKDSVFIGKTGQLRFKSRFVKEFGIEKGQVFNIGIDSEEKIPTALYMVKSDNQNGLKVMYGNSQYFLCAKGLADHFGIKTPCQCKYERFTDEGGEYIKLILPNP